MSPEQLISAMRAQRCSWVALGGSKKLRLMRPTLIEVGRHFFKTQPGEDKPAFRVELEDLVRFVVGWEGFMEADLVGAAGAGDIAAPFDSELCQMLLADKPDWFNAAANALAEAVIAHNKAQEADEKN